MKAITEDFLRVELRNVQPEVYYIPEGKILTPAARGYPQQRKIRAAIGRQPAEPAPAAASAAQPVVPTVMCAPKPPRPKYADYETGTYYMEKPEHMTQLSGNVLVTKDHPRIYSRGKLNSLQALVVLDQAQIAKGGCQKLVDDLGNILGVLREMIRCDVLDEASKNEIIIGLTHAKLRGRSHNPQRLFGVQYMRLPDHTMDRDYALLNRLRAAVREVEVAAAEAFRVGNKYTRKDVIKELNCLSSTIHIMMRMYLTG